MLKPRFLQVNDEIMLVMVEYVRGRIMEIHGPVQAKSAEGVTNPVQFINDLTDMMLEALHVSEVIQFESLPEELKAELHSSSSVSSSSS